MSVLGYGFGANYRGFLEKLKGVSKESGRSVPSLVGAYVVSLCQCSCGLTDFLNYRLWEKTGKERREYVTIGRCDKLYETVSPSAHKTFFTVKPNFLRNFKPWIHRDFFDPSQGDAKALEAFLLQNPSFMEKPIDGLAGRDVRKRSAAEISSPEAYYERLKADRMFVEGYLSQHEDMAALAPASVNTIRVMTVCYDDEPEILYACVRIGSGTAHVDNFHAGGMGVALDSETGKLRGQAVNKDEVYFDRHPVTGILFDGYQIPFWEEAKNACLEASKINQNIHCVGWDVAITPDGPAFIEGNRRPGYDLVQMIEKRGCMELVRRVYARRKASLKRKKSR